MDLAYEGLKEYHALHTYAEEHYQKGKINYPKYKNNTQTKTKSNVILKTTKRKLLQIHIIHIRNKINSI